MCKKIIVLALFTISIYSTAFAAQTYVQWAANPGDGIWTNPANWAGGVVPSALDYHGVAAAPGYKAGFKMAGVYPVITSGGTTDVLVAGGGSLASPGGFTVNGATIDVSEYVSLAAGATDYGLLTMSSGTINTGVQVSNATFYVCQLGVGVLQMNGGQINVGATVNAPGWNGTGYNGNLSITGSSGSGTGTLYLDNGSIYATDLLKGTGTANLIITNGILVLKGNKTTDAGGNGEIAGYVSAGWLRAGTGYTLQTTYDSNTLLTTVRATTVQPQASNPGPSNGAANVALNPMLSWTAGDGAVSHNVYFGTVSPIDSKGNQSGTMFNPGTLTPATTYFWRIDEVNESNGVTTGNVWNFITTTGQALSPSPTNNATSVSLNPTLSWTAGSGAQSHNVYFGTVSPGDSQGNQSGTTFNPTGTLTANTTYYWRIDEVIGSNVITGNVWSFATAQLKATAPNPSNAATGVTLNATLSWNPGGGAVSHDVYFGTDSPGTSRGNQAGTTYNPGTMTGNTTYYWRIDEKDGSNNITTGDVWSFTTSNPAPVNPYLSWKNDPTNSIVVNWWNPFATGDSTVVYGPNSTYGTTVNVATVTNFHHVELTNLTPSTTYHYRISSTDGTVGTDKTFTTADAVADANAYSFSFALYGDPRCVQNASEPYNSRHQAVCDWIAAGGYKFALETGDTVWGGGVTVAYPLAAQGYYQDFFNLERNLSGSKVIMATMGNHEVQPPDAGGTVTYTYYYDLYKDAFPTNGPSIDTNKCRVYSFNYGNAHFVSLSSYQIDVTTQKNWLIADLTAARANPNIKWIFVMMHAPLYTTNGHTVAQNMLDAWAPVFEQYGVDIVFAGHNHCYERSFPIRSGQVAADGRAPVYLTNGMGGAEFNSTLSSPLFAGRYGSEALGASTVVTTVTINGLFMTVDTIKNATGQPVDSFTLVKTPPPIAGDFNGDHKVDITDLGIFCDGWLDSGMFP
jgi:hypothetical protein